MPKRISVKAARKYWRGRSKTQAAAASGHRSAHKSQTHKK